MAGEYNPFQSLLSPNVGRTGLFDMRMMSSANRMETPFERGMRSPYAGRGVSGDPMLSQLAGMANEPDYSAFTYNPELHQRALAAGVQPLEASQVKQNTLLPNTGFFGDHPGLSGALEGALYGLASSHGGMTTGESLEGAASGIIGAHRIQEGLRRQQFARPFEAAGALEQLNDMKQRRELQAMDIEHLRAENQKLGRPDHDFRAFGVSERDPNIATVDSTTGAVTTTPNPGYNPNAIDRTTPEGQFFATKRDEAKAAGKPITSTMLGSWQQEWKNKSEVPERPLRTMVEVQDGKGGVTMQEARPGSHFNTAPQTPAQAGGQPAKDAAAKRTWMENELKKPSGTLWMQQGWMPGDKDLQTKMGAYYDKTYGASTPEAAVPGSSQNNAIVLH